MNASIVYRLPIHYFLNLSTAQYDPLLNVLHLTKLTLKDLNIQYTMSTATLLLLPLLVLFCMVHDGLAFAPPAKLKGASNYAKHQNDFSPIQLAAKKRRRKKSTSEGPSNPSNSDDLPDFDIEENMGDDKASSSKPKRSVSSDPDEITSAMMGSANKPTRSVDELISDRSLEKNFQFDEKEDNSLPDLAAIAQQQQNDGMGKKRAKQEARKAAAMARKDDEDEQVNPLKSIPFILDEKGEVSAVKILEAGAWLGIGLLVLWEVYINSPLFDRQAPLAPFVFDFYL